MAVAANQIDDMVVEIVDAALHPQKHVLAVLLAASLDDLEAWKPAVVAVFAAVLYASVAFDVVNIAVFVAVIAVAVFSQQARLVVTAESVVNQMIDNH